MEKYFRDVGDDSRYSKEYLWTLRKGAGKYELKCSVQKPSREVVGNLERGNSLLPAAPFAALLR